MRLRQLATAFLFHGDDVLMMRKSKSRIHDAEFWSGIGGHMEPNEINDPTSACLREIEEETGLGSDTIEQLSLKYILIRRKEDEIRQQYVYFGKTRSTEVVQSDEGELHWIPSNKMMERKVSKIVYFMLENYFQDPNNTDVLVGSISLSSTGEPMIQWSSLKDPLVF